MLVDPAMAASEAVIRKCVHCGFCTATCPTYVLLGDELDSPRGRIYLMKDMLETGRDPTAEIVKHIDRCLSCLSCMTTCPSGVNYMHLVDHARAYIEERYRRPWQDRALRAVLAWVLPHPRRFRAALALARLSRGAMPLIRRVKALRPVAAMQYLMGMTGASVTIPPVNAALEDRLRQLIRRNHVGTVVVVLATPHAAQVASVFTTLLGAPAVEGGADVWFHATRDFRRVASSS